MSLKSVYFPNLNALRFIAALLVIISHIELYKSHFPIDSHWSNQVLPLMGKLGVVLFFVLSGFLITNLLFIENNIQKTISIKNFYIRRVLRIWPLYFFIIILALFVLPYIDLFKLPGYNVKEAHSQFGWKFLFFFLLLPNLALSLKNGFQHAAHTWSIGAEEQFYLLWPVGIKYLKNKFLFMILVIIFYIAIKLILQYYQSTYPLNTFLEIAYEYWLKTPIDCMAIGGIFAVICSNPYPAFLKIKKIIFNKYFQFPVYLITCFLIFRGYNFGFVQYEVFAILFGIIISNLALNKDRIVNLENVWGLNYLGKISYGIYMYHPIVILFVLNTMLKFHHSNSILIYILSLGITIGISSLSYRFFEKQFIDKKIKFSALISGDEVINKQ